jgi:hypothetical protein
MLEKSVVKKLDFTHFLLFFFVCEGHYRLLCSIVSLSLEFRDRIPSLADDNLRNDWVYRFVFGCDY